MVFEVIRFDGFGVQGLLGLVDIRVQGFGH